MFIDRQATSKCFGAPIGGFLTFLSYTPSSHKIPSDTNFDYDIPKQPKQNDA